MKLRVETVMAGVEAALREQIAPLVDDAFASDALRMAQSLLAIVRLSRDDEVALKVEELDRLRAIFADAAEFVGDKGLAGRLNRAASGEAPDLRISELDAEIGRQRDLLVELHAHVENREGKDTDRIGRDIWRTLREIEMKRAPRA